MDMYLTDTKGQRLSFPILPDRFSVKTGALTQSFQIINKGEMRIPRGVTLTGYSFSGMFPGEDMRHQVESFGRTWQKPDEIIAILERWIQGAEKLRLLLTETIVNADVYIDTMNYDYFGTGHISYTLNLNLWPTLTVETAPPPSVPPATTTGTEGEGGDDGKTYGIVQTSGGKKLYVRKGTGSQYEIIDYYENGKRIEIIGKTGNWYITPHPKGINNKGYVYMTYVKLESALKTGTGTGGSGSGSGSSGGKGGTGSGTGGGTSGNTYKVKTGDSLYSIAKAYGVYIDDLWKLNKTAISAAGGSYGNLVPGTVLQIPTNKKTNTTTTSTSSGSSYQKKTTSGGIQTFSIKGTSTTKSLVTKTPTAKKVCVASTATKKTVTTAKKKITLQIK